MGHIPEKLIPHINAAFPANVCLVGTVGADGAPQISPKGSVLVLDDNTLAYWERGMRKAYSNLKANPNVVIWFRNPELRASGILPAGGVARFYGKAQVVESGALRDQVWDKVVEPEKKADPERKGVAVVIKLDTPGGSLSSTQAIVETIFDARIPVIVWVAPSGGYAASAGTFITMAANLAAGRPHLAFVNSASRGAIETLDRAALAVNYTPSTPYPNNGFALALRTVAGAIVRGVGSRVYWVQTGGFDTHAQQGATGGGAYANLMGTLGDGLGAFYSDIRNQGLANDTTVIVFSEFGSDVGSSARLPKDLR